MNRIAAKAQRSRIVIDYRFAIDSGEFPGSMTKALRYVAAINPDVTREQFVTALLAEGLNAQTLTKQFGLSRKFDVESGQVIVMPDGRMKDKE